MLPSAVKKGVGIKKKTFIFLSESFTDEIKLSSKKQKAVIEALKAANAFDANSGIEKAMLLEKCDCTAAPLKTLQ